MKSHRLTQTKLCFCPAAVQFGRQFFILAVYFDPFSVEVHSVAEILLFIFVITLVVVKKSKHDV